MNLPMTTKTYCTRKLSYNPDDPTKLVWCDGPEIEAKDQETAEAMAESYECQVLGVIVEFEHP